MPHHVLHSLVLVIFVYSNVKGQLFDTLFQDLPPIIKKYHTTQKITRYVTSNGFTTSKPVIYRQINKHIIRNYNDGNADDEKPEDNAFLTSKPNRRPDKSRQNERTYDNQETPVNNENRQGTYSSENINTNKRYNENGFVYLDENNYYQTTHKQNSYDETTKSSYYESNPSYYVTNNPFNRPGVKPVVIDDRPPITNRPATKRPGYMTYPRPTDAGTIMFPKDPDVEPDKVVGVSEDDMSEAEKRKYVDLAERMCNKYKSMTSKKIEAIPLLPSPDPVTVTGSCSSSTILLVVGGKVVEIKDFPHMALLGWNKLEEGGYSWKCGGSLISERFVLTAAHCAYQERDNSVVSGPPRVVQLGSSYLDDPGALVVRVSSYIRHPKYKLPVSYYDIALLKLASDVIFSEVIKPACLGVPPRVGDPIIATGWGKTEYRGDQSLELRSVSLPVWSIEECREALGTSRRFPSGPSRESQMCAGDRRGGKDTCQGDSGGPVQIQDGCLWRVVAVTSLGRSCGAAGTPGLYAIAHRAFIAANVFKDQLEHNGDNQNHDNNYNHNANNGFIVDRNEKNNVVNRNNNNGSNRKANSGFNLEENNEFNRNENGGFNRNENNAFNSNDNYNRNNRDFNQKRNTNRNFNSEQGDEVIEEQNHQSKQFGNVDNTRQVNNKNRNKDIEYNRNNGHEFNRNNENGQRNTEYNQDNISSIYNVRVDEQNHNSDTRNPEYSSQYSFNNERVYWNR